MTERRVFLSDRLTTSDADRGAADGLPLDAVLDLMRVRGALMARVRAHAPWGMRLPRAPGATFHAVTAGSCWLRIPGEPPRELHTGDVALLPAGAPHVLASDPVGPAAPWERTGKARARTAAGELVLDGPGAAAQILCAAYDYDRDVQHPLLSHLPPLLVVPESGSSDASTVQATLGMLCRELAPGAAGRGTVVDRLIDVLFVQVLRAWIARPDSGSASWLWALRDPGIGRALAVIHAAPARPWTVDGLAREASLSRATLTRRFTALVGEAPLTYLTRWRMDLAARELRDTDDPVRAVASRVGYASEFAFSRAFSRVRGRSPARYRAEARARAAVASG